MARIDLVYPKIPGSKNCPDGQCIAFEKCDGTNLHWVWDRELGWYAFGTRRDRFDLDKQGIAEFNAAHVGLDAAADIFAEELAGGLEEIFKHNADYDCAEITVFTEFLGPNSFAGEHLTDDPKELVLFDIQTSSGIVCPDRFVEDFGELKIPQVVYRGKLTGQFIHDLRNGKYDVTEGVVCKGVNDDQVWMVKIKTNAYMQRLKNVHGDHWAEYWE